MTREQAKELLPVIQAYAEGKEVQFLDAYDKSWCDCSEAGFNVQTKWRVKPEPREFWLVYCRGACKPSEIWDYKPSGLSEGVRYIHVREVIE